TARRCPIQPGARSHFGDRLALTVAGECLDHSKALREPAHHVAFRNRHSALSCVMVTNAAYRSNDFTAQFDLVYSGAGSRRATALSDARGGVRWTRQSPMSPRRWRGSATAAR